MSMFDLTQGEQRTLAIAAGVDLTDRKVFFMAKADRLDEDADAVFAKDSAGHGIVVTNAPAGLATVTITTADWTGYDGRGQLEWDVQVEEANGTRVALDPVLNGILTVLPSVRGVPTPVTP